ncbi:MAG: hypothetical protein JSS07_11580 [Proteobacteria bacterium]|nr:hypothetical protein [Pseudomonadota bacterium]
MMSSFKLVKRTPFNIQPKFIDYNDNPAFLTPKEKGKKIVIYNDVLLSFPENKRQYAILNCLYELTAQNKAIYKLTLAHKLGTSTTQNAFKNSLGTLIAKGFVILEITDTLKITKAGITQLELSSETKKLPTNSQFYNAVNLTHSTNTTELINSNSSDSSFTEVQKKSPNPILPMYQLNSNAAKSISSQQNTEQLNANNLAEPNDKLKKMRLAFMLN